MHRDAPGTGASTATGMHETSDSKAGRWLLVESALPRGHRHPHLHLHHHHHHRTSHHRRHRRHNLRQLLAQTTNCVGLRMLSFSAKLPAVEWKCASSGPPSSERKWRHNCSLHWQQTFRWSGCVRCHARPAAATRVELACGPHHLPLHHSVELATSYSTASANLAQSPLWTMTQMRQHRA